MESERNGPVFLKKRPGSYLVNSPFFRCYVPSIAQPSSSEDRLFFPVGGRVAAVSERNYAVGSVLLSYPFPPCWYVSSTRNQFSPLLSLCSYISSNMLCKWEAWNTSSLIYFRRVFLNLFFFFVNIFDGYAFEGSHVARRMTAARWRWTSRLFPGSFPGHGREENLYHRCCWQNREKGHPRAMKKSPRDLRLVPPGAATNGRVDGRLIPSSTSRAAGTDTWSKFRAMDRRGREERWQLLSSFCLYRGWWVKGRRNGRGVGDRVHEEK